MVKLLRIGSSTLVIDASAKFRLETHDGLRCTRSLRRSSPINSNIFATCFTYCSRIVFDFSSVFV
jgi:hypothetical protein